MKKTKICVECNNKVDSSARFCPQCGADKFREPEQGKKSILDRYLQSPPKWYKCIMVFSPIFSVVSSIIIIFFSFLLLW